MISKLTGIRSISLRVKIASAIVLFIFASVVAAGMVLAWRGAAGIRANQQTLLQDSVRDAAGLAYAAASHMTDHTYLDQLAAFHAGRLYQQYAIIMDAAGRVVACSATSDSYCRLAPPPVHESGQIGEGKIYEYTHNGQKLLEVSYPVMGGGHFLGTVRYGLNTDWIGRSKKEMEKTAGFFFIAAGLIAVIAVLAANKLARLITDPLLLLKESAVKAGRGQYAHKLKITGSSEFREVADAFNGMLHNLKRSRARLVEEERLRNALAEKETLLRELYHRTKNNMQVISSLIHLQASAMGRKEVMEMLDDTRNRIQAMALVHAKLYKSKDLSNLDIKDYIGDLAASLLKSYRRQDSMALNLDLDSVLVSLDTATTCGLIINELLSNSMKYAFAESGAGVISIGFHQRVSRSMDLSYSDNGAGFPAGFDFRASPSLGLRLVHSLATRQLKGTFDIRNENGAEFIISFTDSGPRAIEL